MWKSEIFKCAKRYSILLIIEIALASVVNLAVVRGNTIISEVIDDMLEGSEIAFQSFLLQFLLMTIAGFVAAFLQRAAGSWYSILTATRYKDIIAEKIYRIEYKFFDTNSLAVVLNKVLGDVNAIINFLNSVFPEMIVSLVGTIIYAVYIWRLNPRLLILIVICYPAVIRVTNRFAKRIGKLGMTFRQKTDIMTEIAQDVVSGILVLRSFGLEKVFQKKMHKAAQELVDNEQKRTTLSNTAIVIQALIQWLPNIICALYAVYLVKNDSISLGGLVAFILILNKFVESFIGLPFMMIDASEGIVSARRIEEILSADEETGGTGTLPLDTDNVIAFQNVDFGYDTNTSVLHNLSFDVKKGENIAFVGESGGGKSTIFNLLCGFYEPVKGSYKLFGRRFKEWDISAARGTISLVSQNVFLFPVSIEQNISYGNPNATHKEIVEACKKAEIHDFIMTLPDGYDTLVGERGAILSGGQKQRISIARAILKDAPILLLDEPTSAIDVETEQLIQKAIKSISKGRTCITIAHRLSTIKDCDRIMVLDHGKIVESGRHDELIELGGTYAEMYGAVPAGVEEG